MKLIISQTLSLSFDNVYALANNWANTAEVWVLLHLSRDTAANGAYKWTKVQHETLFVYGLLFNNAESGFNHCVWMLASSIILQDLSSYAAEVSVSFSFLLCF